jgi:uncharacterized protein YbjT (DUF2867 family)
MNAAKVAVVAGSTGLIGACLLRLLATAPEYRHVIALARRTPALSDAKIEVRGADFERIDQILSGVHGGESGPLDVFCCLGTTIKAAGSPAAFRRVDFGYVLALARWAKAADARRFLVVSALGADRGSRIFYNRVKGEMEEALAACGLRSVVVLRPSLLDGPRAQSRPGERIALALTRPLRGLIPKRVRPVLATDVAASLLLAARAGDGPTLVESAQMHGAAARL